MEKEIESKIPVDPIQRLRDELAAAVETAQYERAARIRDQLRQATSE